jgi:hypothetical protein
MLGTLYDLCSDVPSSNSGRGPAALAEDLGQHLKMNHDCVLPHTFQFIVIVSFL